MPGRVEGGDRSAPGVADDDQCRDCPAVAYPVGGGGVVARGHVGVDNRLVLCGGLVHLRRPGRFSVAAHVHHVDIIAGERQYVHPRNTVQAQVESGLGGVGGAMHKEYDVVAVELVHRLQALVSHVEGDARIRARDVELFGDDLRDFCGSALGWCLVGGACGRCHGA